MLFTSSAVGQTSAVLFYSDYAPGPGYFDTVASDSGVVSHVTDADLSIPTSLSRPEAEFHVGIGSVRFAGRNPASSSPGSGFNQLTFSGGFLDQITIPVPPGSSGTVQVIASLDGSLEGNSDAINAGLTPSAWTEFSVRAHAGASGGAGNTGEPFSWDVSAVPYGETDTLSPLSTEKLVASPLGTVDSGPRIAIFEYINASSLPGSFYLNIETSLNAVIHGQGALDFLHTFSMTVQLSENTAFSTSSGDTSYIHTPSQVPDATSTPILALPLTLLLLAHRRRPAA